MATDGSAPNANAAGARIAAIDVGSNSIRLVVAEVLPSGGYRVLDEERENTRLAAALSKTGRLDPKAADATVNVLRNFLSITNGYSAGQIRAIGTSALRDAEDGPEFCDRVRKELKLSIDVISAAEEARLAFLSVARAFDISGREVAVADIGGGSTEIVLASSGLIDQIYDTKLGAVRVTEDCGLTGRSIGKASRAASRFCGSCAQKASRQAAVRARHAVRYRRHVYGASGNDHGSSGAGRSADVGLSCYSRRDSPSRGGPRANASREALESDRP